MNSTETSIDLPDLFDQPALEQRPKRTRRKLLASLVAIALSLAGLTVGGATYETIAAGAHLATLPASGRLIDVGGHRLYLQCEGTGGPTIVMDAGLGGSSLDWLLVRAELVQSVRVCTFDRAGMGWSEPGPLPRSPSRNADELHRLLHAGGIQGPYVLVGHSLAGKNIRMFAAAYPQEVAGMVLVDARSERMDLDATAEVSEGMTNAIRTQASLFAVARPLGLVRLFGASIYGAPNLTSEQALQLMLRQTEPNAIAATVDEGVARADDDEALAGTSLGNLPLVVLAAADSMSNNQGWPAAQNGMAKLSSKGRLVIAEHSSHAVQLDEPNVVASAILSVLADARKSN